MSDNTASGKNCDKQCMASTNGILLIPHLRMPHIIAERA
jgi:hypothetical protein